MRKSAIFCALAVGLAAAHPAFAADPAPVRVVPPPPPYDWSGWYLGLHGGYGWSVVDWTTAAGPPSNHEGNGPIAGAQIGYNWRVRAGVVGVELDGSWAEIRGSALCPNPLFTCGTEVEGLTSFRGRFGTVALDQRTLLYGTAGWAWAKIVNRAVPLAGGFTSSETYQGPALGLGVEIARGPYFRFKLEYVAYLFLDQTTAAPAPVAGSIHVDPTVHTIKFGVNYPLR